jgi:hypothetical protein
MGSNGGSSSSGFKSNIVKNDWWSDWFFGPHFGQNPLESIGSLIKIIHYSNYWWISNNNNNAKSPWCNFS